MKTNEELRVIHEAECLQYPREQYPELYQAEEDKKAELLRYAHIAGHVVAGREYDRADMQEWFASYMTVLIYEKLCNENGIYVPYAELIELYQAVDRAKEVTDHE